VADHEEDAGFDQPPRRHLSLPDAAGVVGANQPDETCEYPTAPVEVRDRQLEGGPVARAGGGKGSGEWGGEADPDLLRSAGRAAG
jgi:hypothetical protein